MSTIRDLTINDVNNAVISIEWKGDTITGVLRDIRTDTDTMLADEMIGTRKYRRGEKFTRVQISFTNFIIRDLLLDHPCEVIA